MRIIIVGLDGATWSLLKPWIEEGKLPTFKQVLKNSAWGILKSVLPPVTASAWASLLTGKYPGKTGIYDFIILRNKWPPKITLANGSLIRNDSLITILSKLGFKIISVNIPMTYPLYKVNDVLITGVDTPPGKKFAYPDDVYEQLIAVGYKPELDIPYIPGNEKEYLQELFNMIDMRIKVLLKFLDKDYDVLLFFLRETDIVAHTFWRFMDKNHPIYPGNTEFRDAILQVYKKADEMLKNVLERLNEKDYLFILSDHGFGPEYYRVNLNIWLMRKGLLSIRRSLPTHMKKALSVFITPLKMLKLMMRIDATLAVRTKNELSNKNDRGKLGALMNSLILSIDDIDWDNSKAFSLGCIGRTLPIIINPREYKHVLTHVIRRIYALNEIAGKRIIKRVIKIDEIYKKDESKIHPDLLVEFNVPYAGYTLSPPYVMEDYSLFSAVPPTQSGTHTREGILIVKGPNIRNARINNTEIVDIAPTILFILGLKPLHEMDGRILYEIFTDSAHVRFNASTQKRLDLMLKLKRLRSMFERSR